MPPRCRPSAMGAIRWRSCVRVCGGVAVTGDLGAAHEEGLLSPAGSSQVLEEGLLSSAACVPLSSVRMPGFPSGEG